MCEPIERLLVDVPAESVGAVSYTHLTAQEVEAAEQQVKNLRQQLAQLDKELFAIAQDMQVCGNGLKKFGQGAVGGRQRKAGRKQLASVLEEAEAAYLSLIHI